MTIGLSLAVTSLGAQIALVIFLTIFVGAIFWLWLTPKSRWKKDARIPLDEAKRAQSESRHE